MDISKAYENLLPLMTNHRKFRNSLVIIIIISVVNSPWLWLTGKSARFKFSTLVCSADMTIYTKSNDPILMIKLSCFLYSTRILILETIVTLSGSNIATSELHQRLICVKKDFTYHDHFRPLQNKTIKASLSLDRLLSKAEIIQYISTIKRAYWTII